MPRAPEGVGGLADHVANPAFAAPVGVVQYAHGRMANSVDRETAGAISRWTGRVLTIFKEFF